MDMGIVYLVGAGPGDLGLVTLKARQVIGAADVIVYDRLVPEAALSWAKPDAELVYVGKLPDRHTMKQEEINRLLVERGREGKTVCRLKGGDPFVFGRGGEEALELAKAGVRFEVVPGVTSAISGPAYAGIPVTHRGKATSVAFVTGHEDPTKDESAIDWARLATGVDTLVFLMGVGNLPLIARELLEHGRPPDTPVALIERATTPSQRTVTGPLQDIASLAKDQGVKAPALIVVGEVAALREHLQWFERRPLLGWRVLVTRTREQASMLSVTLEELGAIPIEVAVIAIERLEDYGVLDEALHRVTDYDWLVFTSPNGVAAVLQRLRDLGMDVRALAGPRVAAIGPGTANALEETGVRVDLVPEAFVAESLAGALMQEGVAGKRVLIARAEEAREVLPEALGEAGAEVTIAPCYRTVPRPEAGDRVRQLLTAGELDCLTFASSSSVKAFVECVGTSGAGELTTGVAIACIGPVTADTAKECGMHVDVIAEEHSIPGLVRALVEYAPQRAE